MAGHYHCVVIPARPYRPKDKSRVELSVLLTYRWILARLRHQGFLSLDDLNAAGFLSYAPKLPGRFHALRGDRKGQFAFHLQGGCRLVIEPVGNPLPSRADGSPPHRTR